MKWASLFSLLAFGIVAQAASNDAQLPLSRSKESGDKPNIVFILTDDQDMQMNSLSYMPHVQKHLISEGTLFQRHYCTIALCCPSRVSLWTGRAAHNTNVTDINPPYGGYPKFVSQGFNEAWLPLWFQDARYATYYTGKLFNSHTISNYDSPFPSGFNGSDFLLDPYTYQYLNASFQRNREPPVSHEGEYSTDVLGKKAFGFLDAAIAGEQPFFLTVASNAPHSNVKFLGSWFDANISIDTIEAKPPIPAERHKHYFSNAIIPRTPNFNPEEPSGVSWVSRLERQNQTNVDFNDEFYRDRLRALQAVDEIVDGIFSRLAEANILDNTYVFYSSDNGYHIGQHRLQPGKECGFEEDINIPLIVRGPGVPQGYVSDIVTTHTDLAPTFLSLTGGDFRSDFDGAVIPLTQLSLDKAVKTRHEHVNVEYWGFAITEGKYVKNVYWNNTYKALRLVGEDYSLYYSVWCSGEHELYDMTTDPYQLKNHFSGNHSAEFLFAKISSDTPPRKTTLSHLLSRLDSLLLVLKSCKARECTHPWEVLHPDGKVKDLHDALHGKFDHFYQVKQERVSFSKCEKGYILESEGPIGAKAFTFDDVGARGDGKWSDLV